MGSESQTVQVVERLLRGSRFLVLFSVLGTELAALCVYVGSAMLAGKITIEFASTGIAGDIKAVAVGYMRVVDLFLIATAFQLMSVGMYRLFINPEFEIPGHMAVKSFTDLKQSLASIVAVVLLIIFLDYVVTAGPTLTLPFGLAIAAIIAAAAWTIRQLRVKSD